VAKRREEREGGVLVLCNILRGEKEGRVFRRERGKGGDLPSSAKVSRWNKSNSRKGGEKTHHR